MKSYLLVSPNKIIKNNKTKRHSYYSSSPCTSSISYRAIMNGKNLFNSLKLSSQKTKALLNKSTYIDSKNILKLSEGKNELKNLDHKKLYSSIITKIDNIIVNNMEDQGKLNNIIRKIDNYIFFLLLEDKANKTKSRDNNYNDTLLSFRKQSSDRSLKITEEASKNKSLSIDNDKINNKNDEGKQYELDSYIYEKKISKLVKRMNEMEKKFSKEKVNYLCLIKEYQKRVTELERQLKMCIIENIPKNEIKQAMCYPYAIKYNRNDEINPKSIPMFNSTKSNHITIKDNKKDYIISYIESSEDTKNNNDNDDSNNNDLENIKVDSQLLPVEKLFGKTKAFFTSHPKLQYIKSLKDGNIFASKKIENQINSLPKQISKLKIYSKSFKNVNVVFPSVIGETRNNFEYIRNSQKK